MSTQGNVGENMLANFSRGPFDKYRAECEFSPVDGIVEEILGRLGCLRRNQRIADVSSPVGGLEIINSMRLMRDHDMCVLNVARVGDDLEELEKEFRNLTVKITNGEPLDDILSASGFPKEFALLSIDYPTVDTEFRPFVVVSTINPSVHPTANDVGGFKSTNVFWSAKGYSPVAMAGNAVVYIRSDLTTSAEVRGVVLRNPDMLFDWSKHNM
jgi:hypothetical protein